MSSDFGQVDLAFNYVFIAGQHSRRCTDSTENEAA